MVVIIVSSFLCCAYSRDETRAKGTYHAMPKQLIPLLPFEDLPFSIEFRIKRLRPQLSILCVLVQQRGHMVHIRVPELKQCRAKGYSQFHISPTSPILPPPNRGSPKKRMKKITHNSSPSSRAPNREASSARHAWRPDGQCSSWRARRPKWCPRHWQSG